MPSWRKLKKARALSLIQQLKDYKINDESIGDDEVKELEELEKEIQNETDEEE